MAAKKRTPLSPERIVGAALELVHGEGLEALSMRRLGAALRCEAMSLYHFFPSKRHLVDAMVDHAIASIDFAPASLPPMEQLRYAMRAYRAMAHRYARFYPVLAVHRLNTPTGVRYIERVVSIVRAIEGDDELAARSFRTLGYYLLGAVIDETQGYAKGPSAAEPVDGAFIERECPNLARAARWFQRPEWDATFELGMTQILAGLERAGAATRKRARVGKAK